MRSATIDVTSATIAATSTTTITNKSSADIHSASLRTDLPAVARASRPRELPAPLWRYFTDCPIQLRYPTLPSSIDTPTHSGMS